MSIGLIWDYCGAEIGLNVKILIHNFTVEKIFHAWQAWMGLSAGHPPEDGASSSLVF